ncbi:MAG: major facilitator superfamily 1 [Deltaproteobacteria bacterium]|nr:major facilitator superfamily 1 [Deltaproteobacteria bacterium]
MTDHDKHSSGIHWAWVILGTSFVTLFVNYSIRIGAYSVLLPKMIQDLHINMTQAGMIRAGYFLTYILFSPLMGWLMDRIGGRFVISFFCLFLGAGTVLMGRASDLTTAVFFHGIVGIGAASIWTPVSALIQKWFGGNKRGLALGILSPSYALGFGLMGILLPTIVNNYSWRMGWYLLGASGLILIAMNFLLLRDDPEKLGLLPWGETAQSTPSPPLSQTSFNYRAIAKEPMFWLIGASYLFISVAVYIVSDFIVTYGVVELKIPYPVASTFISILALTSIVGGFVFMTLSDYIGRAKSLVIIHSLLALSIFLIILTKDNISWLRIGIGWFGFMYGPIFPMYAACARDYFPKEVAGRVIGLLTLLYGIGAMAGPILGGRLTDLMGSFRWSFGIGAFAALLASLIMGFVRKPEELREKQEY